MVYNKQNRIRTALCLIYYLQTEAANLMFEQKVIGLAAQKLQVTIPTVSLLYPVWQLSSFIVYIHTEQGFEDKYVWINTILVLPRSIFAFPTTRRKTVKGQKSIVCASCWNIMYLGNLTSLHSFFYLPYKHTRSYRNLPGSFAMIVHSPRSTLPTLVWTFSSRENITELLEGLKFFLGVFIFFFFLKEPWPVFLSDAKSLFSEDNIFQLESAFVLCMELFCGLLKETFILFLFNEWVANY